ncbi:MAG: hypothetical protein EOP50_13045, partial [Sphingobacteriales bacterium]
AGILHRLRGRQFGVFERQVGVNGDGADMVLHQPCAVVDGTKPVFDISHRVVAAALQFLQQPRLLDRVEGGTQQRDAHGIEHDPHVLARKAQEAIVAVDVYEAVQFRREQRLGEGRTLLHRALGLVAQRNLLQRVQCGCLPRVVHHGIVQGDADGVNNGLLAGYHVKVDAGSQLVALPHRIGLVPCRVAVKADRVHQRVNVAERLVGIGTVIYRRVAQLRDDEGLGYAPHVDAVVQLLAQAAFEVVALFTLHRIVLYMNVCLVYEGAVGGIILDRTGGKQEQGSKQEAIFEAVGALCCRLHPFNLIRSMLSKQVVKDIQRLGLKKGRSETGLFIAEGPKVVVELLAAIPQHVEAVYALPSWIGAHKELVSPQQLHAITEAELERISQLQTPNEVLLVARQWEGERPVLRQAQDDSSLSLYLDAIQDPGNLGTIIRIADWFGIRHVVCAAGTAERFNPKVVQSTMASLARVNVWYDEAGGWLDEQSVPVLA